MTIQASIKISERANNVATAMLALASHETRAKCVQIALDEERSQGMRDAARICRPPSMLLSMKTQVYFDCEKAILAALPEKDK